MSIQYTQKIDYKHQPLTKGESFLVDHYTRLKLSPCHPSYQDASEIFHMERFQYPYLPLFLGDYDISPSENPVNVLRLLIRMNDSNGPVILPKELSWLKTFVSDNINYHRQHYAVNKDAFIHLTVRMTTYEDLYYKEAGLWHIDGFQGARDARHIPEQDILWCDTCPTEFTLQPFFVNGLQPERHNLSLFLQENAQEQYKVSAKAKSLYLMTPYNVHRFVPVPFDGIRTFVRLTFSPVEIEDPTNTPNPGLPRTYPYRRDVRDFLSMYRTDERDDSGFTWNR